jgi:hypothetical protein
MTNLILIGIAVCVIAFSTFFLWCRYRNRKYFLNNIHENQVCRLATGEEDSNIVRIVALYTDYAWVVDQKTLEEMKVPITSLFPL